MRDQIHEALIIFACALPFLILWEVAMQRSGNMDSVLDWVGFFGIACATAAVRGLLRRPKKLRMFAAFSAIENSARNLARPVGARGRQWAFEWNFEEHQPRLIHAEPDRTETWAKWIVRQVREAWWVFGEWEVVSIEKFTAERTAAAGIATAAPHDEVMVASTEGDLP